MKKKMTYWVREIWIQDIYMAPTGYRSLSKLFRQTIKFRLDFVMATTSFSILNLNLKSLPEQKFPLYVQCWSNRGPLSSIVTQGFRWQRLHLKRVSLTPGERNMANYIQMCSHFTDQSKLHLYSEDKDKCKFLNVPEKEENLNICKQPHIFLTPSTSVSSSGKNETTILNVEVLVHITKCAGADLWCHAA